MLESATEAPERAANGVQCLWQHLVIGVLNSLSIQFRENPKEPAAEQCVTAA
jgi:hypothetical protein